MKINVYNFGLYLLQSGRGTVLPSFVGLPSVCVLKESALRRKVELYDMAFKLTLMHTRKLI